MTTFALAAEAAVVYILSFMTTDASAGKAEFAWHRAGVAGHAFQPLMPAVELEFGALVVIEIP